jgi:hypothetical protein
VDRNGHRGNADSDRSQRRQVRQSQRERFQSLARSPYIYIRAAASRIGLPIRLDEKELRATAASA